MNAIGVNASGEVNVFRGLPCYLLINGIGQQTYSGEGIISHNYSS
jgi:hypothetical protein